MRLVSFVASFLDREKHFFLILRRRCDYMNGRRGHERPRTSENKARFYDMIKEITRKTRNEEKRRTLVVLFPQPSNFFEIKYACN